MYLVKRATVALNSPEEFYKSNGPFLITGCSSSTSLNFSDLARLTRQRSGSWLNLIAAFRARPR